MKKVVYRQWNWTTSTTEKHSQFANYIFNWISKSYTEVSQWSSCKLNFNLDRLYDHGGHLVPPHRALQQLLLPISTHWQFLALVHFTFWLYWPYEPKLRLSVPWKLSKLANMLDMSQVALAGGGGGGGGAVSCCPLAEHSVTVHPWGLWEV